jgi:hypothetical protein
VASVSRLDGSAHCRSSTPITSGPDSASSSARSAKASTVRNCSPGSLVTVIGPWLPPPWVASTAEMAARRGSGDVEEHPNAAATRPNGRVRSSCSARPAITCMPRARASPSASWSRRVLPIPASPSMSTIADAPEATRSRASARARVSDSRPSVRDAGADMPMSRCYARPAAAVPSTDCDAVTTPEPRGHLRPR